MRGRICTIVCALLVLAGALTASAQTFTGGLRGEVRDPNGVIPGVVVTLTNEATGVAREVTTNEVGQYNFPAVQPGTYTVKTSLQGYKTYERTGVRIATQQFLTLDIPLEVGQLQETITVTGEAPLIETSNASTGEVIDRKELELLPSPGRAAFLIGVTVPTVVASGDAQFNRQQDQTNASLVSLGGGARRANNYILDGVPITDMRNRAVVNPSIEGLEEVKVQVHTFDAEMGRTGGGVFNTVVRSGTNDFRGSGFYQTRPVWGQANNWFSDRAGIPKPTDLYYRLYGAGFGGPIVRNRTFFWYAMEGYRSVTTRNGSLILPTDREKAGDFSQTFDRNGNLLVVHDPLTRQPFPGNVIPANRLDPVAVAVARLMPTPEQQRSNQTTNLNSVAPIQDSADMFMGKADHKFTDKVSMSGVYLYNKTDEPYEVHYKDNLFLDPSAAPLLRRIHAVVANNTWIPNNNTVLTFRAGWNRFDDNCGRNQEFPFDAKTLPFDSGFANSITPERSKMPRFVIDDYGLGANGNFGAGGYTQIRWYSYNANGTMSKLMGTHTLKAGLDYRLIGVQFQDFGQGSGSFNFSRGFTASATGAGGSPFASFMLGVPRAGSIQVSAPGDDFVSYFGGFIQDDWRVKSNLVINYGLRLERETGLQEKNDQIIVAFDQEATSPLSGRVPGLGTIRGGLVYAGQNGANTYAGNPRAVMPSPRVGIVWSANRNTVVRAGYGVFWAPWNYQFPSAENYGNLGYNAITALQQSAETAVPTAFLRNPFPGGYVTTPTGSSLGLLTATGNNISFIDQNKRNPYVQQISLDVQRELPGNMAVSVGFAHARGDDLGLGGTNDGVVNINQIRDTRALTPAELNASVPNPFLGVEGAGGFAGRTTIQRGQLLRPFPQFGDVNVRQMTAGRSRYNALILKLDRRVTSGWGGRFNYTYSNLKDNQFAETNHYTNRVGSPQNNYDLEAEYGVSLLDMPHKIALAPIVELPFGQGRRWAQGRAADLIIGGWTVSAVASFESGFPLGIGYATNVAQTQLGLFGNTALRPNPTGTNPETSGDLLDERVGSATPYINANAYTLPALGQFGTLERNETRIRTPFRTNLDMVFTKFIPTGGSSRAEVRLEMLNLTNTPKFRGDRININPNLGTFGQITTQSGFSRITQLSVRFTF
jgi:hypothetical protein